MTPELESLSSALLTKLDEIVGALDGLSEDELNQAPDVAGANSCFVIATHAFGNMRASVLGIACGLDIHRTRSDEFRSRGTFADLRASAGNIQSEIQAALAALDSGLLNERFVPSQELWGDGIPHEESRREAIIHPIEHAGIHLGQIMLTVDLLRQSR